MKQKKIILFATLASTLVLLSCSLFTNLTPDQQSNSEGLTAIVQLTQIAQKLAFETAAAESTQSANANQNTTNPTSVPNTYSTNGQTFSSDFETDDMFSEYADDGGLVESHFSDGGLQITIHEPDVYFWSYPHANIPQNTTVQVDAKLVDGDIETGAGVICRYDYDTDNGIYFEITFDGYFVVLKKSDSGWEYLEEYTETDLIAPYQFNTIKAICNDSSYQFIVNDQLVANFTDSEVLGDETAIYGYTYYQPESVILFDNFYAEGLK
jgi:hypothetical protein